MNLRERMIEAMVAAIAPADDGAYADAETCAHNALGVMAEWCRDEGFVEAAARLDVIVTVVEADERNTTDG